MNTIAPHDPVWLAVADLHGHRAHFNALLAWAEAEFGAGLHLCTLGDYVDNGREIPALLDDLIALRERLGERFVPILGNHDLALLRALGWPDSVPDELWYKRWSRNYWNAGLGTPAAYGARTLTEFSARFPARHRAFLESLPWVHDTGRWLFVHAGMEPGPLAPQRAALTAKRLPPQHEWLPPQLRDKELSKTADAAWDRVAHPCQRGLDERVHASS
nr:metallophosphoesterase [Deltaproteobacteria bacterium]